MLGLIFVNNIILSKIFFLEEILLQPHLGSQSNEIAENIMMHIS